jgi:hypothetical protein
MAVLAGCAGTPPSDGQLSALPVVTYPDMPPAGDYIYRLPAGRPIDVQILADGSALTEGVAQTLSASLVHDIYLHKQWASEDGVRWQRADKLIGVNLSVLLPSYATPGAGKVHLSVERMGQQ